MLILTDDTAEADVRPHLQVLPQPNIEGCLRTFAQGDVSARFVPLDNVRNSLESVGSRYWFRLTVKNGSVTRDWLLAFLPASRVETEVYLPDASGGHTLHTASTYPASAGRAFEHRYAVHPLNIAPGAVGTIYIHAFAGQASSMGIWSYAGFLKHSRDYELVLGLFYGVAMAMALHSLFLFFSLREMSYLYYALFVVFFALLLACWDGTALEYLHPHSTPPRGSMSIDLFGNLSAMAASLFIRRFLDTRRHALVIGRFLGGSGLFFAVMAALAFLRSSATLTIISAVAMIPALALFFTSGGLVLARGFRPARYVLYGMAPALISAVVSGLSSFGVMNNLELIIPLVYLSFVLASVLFSLALSEHISAIRRAGRLSESLNIAKTEFFVNLSHEVKTPLTIISNYLDSYMSDHSYSEDLFVMKRAVDKLSRDMAQFFDVLRFEKGITTVAEAAKLDFSKLTTNRVMLFDKLGEAHGVKIDADIVPGIIVIADPTLLTRVVDNLLENAVKYNQPGGAVHVVLAASDSAAILEVSDTGIGIDSDHLQEIFAPYYQVSTPKRSRQGIGLGLHLVRQIINSLGGSIRVTSSLGTGTTFTVTIPSPVSQESEKSAEVSEVVESYPLTSLTATDNVTSPRTEGQPDPTRQTILVAEDNADLLALLVRALQMHYNVLAARDGAEALEKLRTSASCSLVITDIMMDDVSGYELLNRLQENPRFERVPCIFMSAKTLPEERFDGLQRGAIDYIYKPFPVDELLLKVDSITRVQRKEKEQRDRDQLLSLRALVSGFAHEIRNPLSGITGPLGNLERQLERNGLLDDPQTAKHLRFLTVSARKIEDITTTLRAIAGERSYEFEALNMRVLIESTFSSLRDLLPRGVHLEARVDGSAAMIGDRGAVELILRNLTANALNAVGGNGTVTVGVDCVGGRSIIVVSDDGIGMSPETAERIFDAFYTGNGSGGGMGVGLFLVRRLCVDMGWQIGVESHLSQGTTISVGPPRRDAT